MFDWFYKKLSSYIIAEVVTKSEFELPSKNQDIIITWGDYSITIHKKSGETN
jgi:hypothetical protein